MKYKKIFKSWWFYLLIILYALYEVFRVSNEYGNFYLIEIIGILLGSFIGVWFFVTIIWLLIKGFRALIKKVTKR